MKTRINIYDHAAGMRDSITIPLSHDATVCRLRKAIGEPTFEVFDEDIAVYARVDVEPIAIHIFSYSAEAAAGAWNEVINTLMWVLK